MNLFIQSKVSDSKVIIESSEKLTDPVILDETGNIVVSQVLYTQEKNNEFITVFDAADLQCWAPAHPALYTLKSGEISQRFGYCELAVMDNRSVLLNGTPCFLRGYIRGIVAHEHPNMTGKSLKEAAVKNIRQAKKYGFNLVRFHSTVPPMEFVEAADEEGLFIHMEIGFAYERDAAGNKKNLAMSNERWEETILRYRNHPSVAIFCIGNEMHKSGHYPQVHKLYEQGKKLAPSKLIMDNSGWGEFDRSSADIFSQHIAYYFPYKHHQDMFNTDNCWRLNGSAFDGALECTVQGKGFSAAIRREAVPMRPVLAHEALHYIDIPDYEALNRKFDNFCAAVGADYLRENGIEKPRYLTDLPALIKRKNLTAKLPDYIAGSREFKKMGYKTYLERLRLSGLCGFEMLQFADCLKYENKNGIVDFFDDDKYFDAEWMNNFNGDAALLADFGNEIFYADETITMQLYISNFMENPRQRGSVKVTVGNETVWEGHDIMLAGNLQKLAAIELRLTPAELPAKIPVSATFTTSEITLKNSWHIWLYPRAAVAKQAELALCDADAEKFFTVPGASANSNIFVTDTLTDAVLEKLADGKDVLLLYHRDKPGNQYYLPGALERFKPCIWDRGSNLGGFISLEPLSKVLGNGRYFDLNMQPLLEGAYKVNLDKFPFSVTEHINGIDKPVRDRMKGLLHGVKDFIEEDTLRNFSHCFSLKVSGGGVLTVCTLGAPQWKSTPVTDNFFAALLDLIPGITTENSCTIAELKSALDGMTAAGVCKEDVMNHFWEIDNKPVEDTLFWEEAGVDLRKKK